MINPLEKNNEQRMALERLAKAVRTVSDARQKYNDTTKTRDIAIRDAIKHGVIQRDIAVITGLTPQRVGQIAHRWR